MKQYQLIEDKNGNTPMGYVAGNEKAFAMIPIGQAMFKLSHAKDVSQISDFDSFTLCADGKYWFEEEKDGAKRTSSGGKNENASSESM
jgi:hypothetical protein